MATCPTCGDEYENEAGMKVHHKRIHGESLSGVKSTCEVCGDDFRHRKSDAGRFCSHECYAEHKSEAYQGEGNPNGTNRVTLTCPICDSEFEEVAANADRRVCCSRECMGKYRSKHYVGENHHKYKKVKIQCHSCGDTLHRQPSRLKKYNNQFCDQECYGDFLSKEVIDVECAECGASLERRLSRAGQFDNQFCDSRV